MPVLRANKVPERATDVCESFGTIPEAIALDREQAFMLYATFCGDVERTAAALNVRPIDILRAADEDNWNIKLQSIIALKKSDRPGDIERAINRAINFVQAHRTRLFLDRMLKRLNSMSADELDSYLLTEETTKSGSVRRISTRPIADLTSALEKAHAMTYAALNDTAGERKARGDDEDQAESSAGALHAQIADALAKVRGSASPRSQLLAAQLAQGQELVEQKVFQQELKQELKK